MKKVILLRGLSGSGKSTWAKELMANSPGVYKRINKDLLREMLDGSKWSKDNEKFIISNRDHLITMALLAGKSVIVDDTNLHASHETKIRDDIQNYNAVKLENVIFEVKDFTDVPINTCIERDLKRCKSVGEMVIRRQYEQFLKPTPPLYIPPKDKPQAIICDIDGTLAQMVDRSPYDYTKVRGDKPRQNIVDLVKFHQEHYVIIIVSGRTDECKQDTMLWLANNGIPFNRLFMRKAGDDRNDTIVKKEIFDKEIRDNFDVKFVLDDRDRCVQLWRSLGLDCLQVNDGNF